MNDKEKIKFLSKIGGIFKAQSLASHKKAVEGKISNTANKFERCVMCGDLTSVPFSTPIMLRDCYEIGCGQLCGNCYKNLRKQKQNLSN